MNLLISKSGILFFLIFLSSNTYLSSQNISEGNCGTVMSTESLELYNSLKPQLKAYEEQFNSVTSTFSKSKSKIISTIPVQVHIIRDSNGDGGLRVNELMQTIDNLNSVFKDIYIKFSVINTINYINNDSFYHLNKRDENQLTKNNYTEGALNLYFVNKLENESKYNICGYANIAQNANIIVVQNGCAINDSTLSHEIGHLLSLVHTHGPTDIKTTELVDGSNCDTDGDGVCDTPADPKLDSKNTDDSCNYIGNAKDANGDEYEPDTSNIMSYAHKGCRTHFSKLQQARMYAFYQFIKMQFYKPTNQDDDKPILANAIIYPNPVTNGILNISCRNMASSIHYEISDLYGQVFSKGFLKSKEIDVSNLSSGAYILSLNDGTSWTIKKFLK